MTFVYQFGIILAVTFIGEVLGKLLPFPIPASIYGLVIMLFCLKTRIIKLERISQAGSFLLETMPLMFLPAAVGLIVAWKTLKNMLFPVVVITIVVTVVVMAVTGRTTQFFLRKDKKNNEDLAL